MPQYYKVLMFRFLKVLKPLIRAPHFSKTQQNVGFRHCHLRETLQNKAFRGWHLCSKMALHA
eukprot:4502663-Amphidinium_carterae.1